MKPESKKKLLIVDSDSNSQLQIREELAKGGYECIFVGDPSKVKMVAEEQFRKDWPHAIIIDIILPAGSGFALSRELTPLASKWKSPIILMSKYKSPEDELECTTAGAQAVLSKPLLLSALEQLFEKLEIRKLKNQIASTVIGTNQL